MAMAVSLRRAIKGLAEGAEVVRSSGLSAWSSPRAFSSSLASLISEEEVRCFEEDWATVVRQLFAPEWLDQLRAPAEENMRNPGVLYDEHVKPGEPGRFHDDHFLWRRHETMRRFIHEFPCC